MKYFLSILFCSFISVHAQQIAYSGKVLDQTDGLPVAGAKIRVIESESVSVSNAKGIFSFYSDNRDSIHLLVSSMGFVDQLVSLDKGITNVIISLHPSIEDLEAVVVTATRSEKRLKEVPVLTQVILPSRLRAAGITTVSAALEHEVPGLDFAYFQYRPKVTFQGMNAKYVLFLVDGERIAGELDGDIDYSRLNLDNVERIEVVRGASSALYGSNAMGGVINIITKRPIAMYELNSYTRYSKFNELSAGVTGGFRKNNFSSVSNFIYNQNDGYDLTPIDSGGIPSLDKTQEMFKNGSVNQKFEYTFSPKLSLKLNGSIFYNKLYDGDINAKPSNHAYSGFNNGFLTTYKLNDSNTFEIGYASDKYFNYSVNHETNEHFLITSDFCQSLKIVGHSKIFIGNFTYGTEYMPENLYSTRISNTNRSVNEKVAFVQNDFKLNKTFSAVLGGRTSYHSNFGFSAVPKISLMANFNSIKVRTSYGMGFRSPTLKELYLDFLHGDFKIIGNSTLKPEKSNYYGLSLEYADNFFNFVINSYYNYVYDLIVYQITSYNPIKIYQYNNISIAKVMGVDIMAKALLTNSLYVSSGVGLVDGRDDSSKLIYDISPISINFNVNYSFALLKQRTSVEIFGKYVGARSYLPTTITYEDKPFQNWRLTATQQYSNTLSVTLGVDNLFNEVDVKSLGNISPGRRYFFSLNFSIKKY